MSKWFKSCRFIISPEHTYEFSAYTYVLFLESTFLFLVTPLLSSCQLYLSNHFLPFDLHYFIFQIVFELFSNSSLYFQITIQGVYVLSYLNWLLFLIHYSWLIPLVWFFRLGHSSSSFCACEDLECSFFTILISMFLPIAQ